MLAQLIVLHIASYNYYIAIDYHSGQPTFKKDSMKVRSKSLQAEIRMIWDFHASSIEILKIYENYL